MESECCTQRNHLDCLIAVSSAFCHQGVCFDIPMAAYRYAGAGSTVEFGDVAGTVTFEHTHWRQPRNKRAVSPWIVPVGAIEGISWREATASKSAEMRLLLRGRKGHNRDGRADSTTSLARTRSARWSPHSMQPFKLPNRFLASVTI